MFKIVDESPKPTRTRFEFEAMKKMTKENYNFNKLVFVYSFVWFLMLLYAMFDNSLLMFFTAGTVVMLGLSFFYWVLTDNNKVPKKYRILYKKSYSSKR